MSTRSDETQQQDDFLLALEQSDERFRNTFAQAAVGLAHVAPDGRFLHFISVIEDVSERKKIEQSLAEQLAFERM